MSSLTQYRSYLSDYLMNYHDIKNLKDFFHCLNPNHIDNHPSMRFTDKYNICKCFACGVSYDIFDLVGMDFHLDSFKDKINKIQELYLGIVPKVYTENDLRIDEECDYTNYYKKCVKNISKSDYLINRGITNDLIKKYHIGYDEEKNLIVFPITKKCYFARSAISNDKIKSKGNSDIWNKQYLCNSKENDLIYVTESIIDALSLEVIDPNIKAISINGVGNINSLLRRLKESRYKGNIVISFDNDLAGIQAQNKLKDELKKLNINCFSTTLISNFIKEPCKDINEALIKDYNLLEKNYNYFNNAFNYVINKKEGESELSYEG